MTISKVTLLAVLLAATVREQAVASATVYRYIDESLVTMGKNNFRDFVGMVNMGYFRTLYPQAFGVPRWPEFLQQQQDEGLDEKRAINRYNLALLNDPLSEDGIREALMQDAVYRAHVFAYAILYSSLPNVELRQNEMIAIANASQNIVPLVMAIDADYSLTELFEHAVEILQHKFNFSTHQAASELNGSEKLFGHTGNYLMRSNEEELEDAGSFQTTQLIRLGFDHMTIEALSYRARDAIIISDPDNKDDFVSNANALLDTSDFDVEAINAAVADIGPLVFTLPQYDYKLDEINKHDIDALVKIFNFR